MVDKKLIRYITLVLCKLTEESAVEGVVVEALAETGSLLLGDIRTLSVGVAIPVEELSGIEESEGCFSILSSP
jgi:hypothetical protein